MAKEPNHFNGIEFKSEEVTIMTGVKTCCQLCETLLEQYKQQELYYKRQLTETQEIVENLQAIVDRESKKE